MFEISVKSHFSSAHRLKGYEGVCHNLHGHNWEVEVFCRGIRTNAIGMLVDFGKVKSTVRKALTELDHQDLNRLPIFAHTNPTSENLAKYLFKELSRRLNSKSYKVHRVWVSESPGTAASYWEEDQNAGREQRRDGKKPKRRKR